MNGTYCGKDCQACACREELNCGGCQTQRQHCTIAQCCRDRWQQSCQTCDFGGECYKLRGKDSMPENIRRQQRIAEAAEKREAARAAEAQRREEELVRRAPWIAKWLNVMFWLVILAGVMDFIWDPLAIVGSLAYAGVLLQLRREDGRYQTAAVCKAAAAAVSLVVVLISGGGDAPTWTLVLSLPAAVVRAVGTYNEYMAHGNLVGAVDAALGDRWENLWKWMVLSVGAMIGSAVIGVLIPVLGLLGIFAAAIAALVVCVMEMVTLYRSAEAFKQKAASFVAGNAR